MPSAGARARFRSCCASLSEVGERTKQGVWGGGVLQLLRGGGGGGGGVSRRSDGRARDRSRPGVPEVGLFCGLDVDAEFRELRVKCLFCGGKNFGL